MNTFGAGDTFEHLALETTHFALDTAQCVLEVNTYVPEMNALKIRVKLQLYLHTASYQQLPNGTYVKLTFDNRRYPTGEIQKVCRCTMASSVALNWSSRPSKYRIAGKFHCAKFSWIEPHPQKFNPRSF